jgi:hypothetical protein
MVNLAAASFEPVTNRAAPIAKPIQAMIPTSRNASFMIYSLPA